MPLAAGQSRDWSTRPPRLVSGGEQPEGHVTSSRTHLAAELVLVQGRALSRDGPSAVLGSLTPAGHLRGEANTQGAKRRGTPAVPRPQRLRVCAPFQFPVSPINGVRVLTGTPAQAGSGLGVLARVRTS